jgi:hypothetical protein
VLKYIESLHAKATPAPVLKTYFASEIDNNQTSFEFFSNRRMMGVRATNLNEAAFMLLCLRWIVDRHHFHDFDLLGVFISLKKLKIKNMEQFASRAKDNPAAILSQMNDNGIGTCLMPTDDFIEYLPTFLQWFQGRYLTTGDILEWIQRASTQPLDSKRWIESDLEKAYKQRQTEFIQHAEKDWKKTPMSGKRPRYMPYQTSDDTPVCSFMRTSEEGVGVAKRARFYAHRDLIKDIVPMGHSKESIDAMYAESDPMAMTLSQIPTISSDEKEEDNSE